MKCKRFLRFDENMKQILVSKKKFETLDLAITEAKRVNSFDHTIHKMIAYKCDECFKYHIGKGRKLLTDKERKKYKNERIINQ